MTRGGLARAVLLAALFVLLLAAVASAGMIRRGGAAGEAELPPPDSAETGIKARLTADKFDVSGRLERVEYAGNTYIRFSVEESQ